VKNINKSKISVVCIDDFALKKRQRYGTVMVDMETHKIVDMIESREMRDVSLWLAEYPNLRIISRDGSQTYAAAITQAHPSAMQVSDRFHILKNLNERATLAFQKLFQGRIAIPITTGTQDIRYEVLIGTKAERIRLVKKLRGEGRSMREISLLTGLSARMVKNYSDIRERDIPEDKHTVRGREHEEAVKKLSERANRVRTLRETGLSLTEIAQKTGFTLTAVRNYLAADFSPVNAHYGKQREGKLEPFREDVFRWKAEGLTYREIHERIRVKGYSGTQDAIRSFISKERRIRRDLQMAVSGEAVEFIDKKWMIRLLYKPAEDVKGISSEQLAAIFKSYPLAESILHIVNEFKSLIKEKNPDALPQWMDKTAALGFPELNAFIGGLRQDIDAVMNAITSDFSNGLVEGTVNKIKVIKRIMYGRCRFNLLRNKCLLLNHDP
jgi:predicted transcriptional regulator